jgi:hypothetical protein
MSFGLLRSCPRGFSAIYVLDKPLASGGTMNMSFEAGYCSRAFKDRNGRVH